MKVKVKIICIKDFPKEFAYVVSSAFELFDKMMRMRQRKFIRRVLVGTRHYQGRFVDSRVIAAENIKPEDKYDFWKAAPIRFFKDVLSDNDRYEELVGQIWAEIEKLPAWKYDRTNNVVPPQLARSKKKS